MQKGQHRELTWVVWPGNPSVEYQIEDNNLRIRRWVNGSATVSEWERCGAFAEATINHQLSVMRHKERMDQLPTLPKRADESEPHHHDLLDWVLSTLFHPAGPPN